MCQTWPIIAEPRSPSPLHTSHLSLLRSILRLSVIGGERLNQRVEAKSDLFIIQHLSPLSHLYSTLLSVFRHW